MSKNSPKSTFVEEHRYLTYANDEDTYYDGFKILDGSVTTEKLADGAVTTDKIADSSITPDKIEPYCIDTDKLEDDAVTTAKIVDDAVTADKIADDSVTTANIVDDAVTADKIADDAVTIDKIADDAVRDIIGTAQDMIDEAITQTYEDEGESVVARDSSYLASLTIDGKAVQDGTPTSSEPVDVQVVESVNLCDSSRYSTSQATAIADYATLTTDTVSGLSYMRNADGTITASGTATASAFIFLPLSREIQVGETVTLTGCPSGGSTTTYRIDLYATNNTIHATDSGSGVTKTVTVPINRIRIACYAGTRNLMFKPQLELGTAATPYIPYGSIGLKVGSTITPINLNGNVLASLPDGTKDVLRVDSAGHVEIEKRVTYTNQAVTDSVTGTVGTDVISSTGEIANGADVYYKAASTTIVDCGYIDMPAIPDGAEISIVAQVTPTIAVKWWSKNQSSVAEAFGAVNNAIQALQAEYSSLDARVTALE